MNPTPVALCALACITFAAPATALDFTMDFDNIPLAEAPPPPPDQDFGSAVLGFYNDDPDYDRDGKQPWNTTFSDNALAICSFPQAGGDCQGNFPMAHSGISAVGTIDDASFRFDVSPGLMLSKFSFWYNAGGSGSNPSVQLLSGDSPVFSQPLDECVNPGGGGFCGWKLYEVPENQLLGKLVTGAVFSSTPNKAVFDDFAVTTMAIPEPSTYALMLGGLALIAGMARRRRAG